MEKTIKTNITSTLFAITCLILSFLFPVGDLKFEIVVAAFVILIILPILYTKIILHKTYSSLGFTSLNINMRDGFFMVSAIVLGGLLSFIVVSLEWGVEAYLKALSDTVLFHFGAFAIYELFFASVTLFLITFFSWGFVYSIEYTNKKYKYIAASVVFIFFLVSFYQSIWVALPMLVPVFFVRQIRDEKNILYMFLTIYIISLILDTLIIKSIS